MLSHLESLPREGSGTWLVLQQVPCSCGSPEGHTRKQSPSGMGVKVVLDLISSCESNEHCPADWVSCEPSAEFGLFLAGGLVR